MTPVNVPFSKADLVSHILWMCLHAWQDQYNLQEKGMTPMAMPLLWASLKAIERVCTQEKGPCAIQQESFSEEQGRNKAAQYWIYEAGS
jgi:hypothetical protein